jgi:hypothetical protein
MTIIEMIATSRISFFMSYFFLYPAGHLGPTAVTFLVNLPLTQLIVVFFAGALACESFTEIVGELKVKP